MYVMCISITRLSKFIEIVYTTQNISNFFLTHSRSWNNLYQKLHPWSIFIFEISMLTSPRLHLCIHYIWLQNVTLSQLKFISLSQLKRISYWRLSLYLAHKKRWRIDATKMKLTYRFRIAQPSAF